MNITTLPDLCLLRIFDHLPPSDLLRLDFVCIRFKDLQPAACLRRTSLQIVVNRDLSADDKNASANLFDRIFFTVPYQEELLDDGQEPENGDADSKTENSKTPALNKYSQYVQYSHIERNDATNLVDIFPNVKHLKLAIVINYRLSDTDELIYLFSRWSTKLVSLNLVCHYDNNFLLYDLMEHLEVNTKISDQLFALVKCINSMSSLKR